MIFLAITIQRAYRTYIDRLFYMEMNMILIPAAVTIQAIARDANTCMWYLGTLYVTMHLQALVRGHQARGHAAWLVRRVISQWYLQSILLLDRC